MTLYLPTRQVERTVLKP